MTQDISKEEQAVEADEKDLKLRGIKIRLQKSETENSSIKIGEWREKYRVDVSFLVKELEQAWSPLREGQADSDVKPRKRRKK